MYKINDNFTKFPGSYLFQTVAKKVADYKAANPDADIIRLGIGDVTLPIVPSIREAMHKAIDEMGTLEGFHGYCPKGGYEFLRAAIQKNDFEARGAHVELDEIFVSDGGKCDCGNIQELFSADAKIAVCDPVYPVYVDSNVIAGRGGVFDEIKDCWTNFIYMPTTKENNFVPEIPEETPDVIYLCSPSNPTGGVIRKAELQKWVDYANKVGAIILFDAAYEAYIREDDVNHTIYECEGARDCCIEMRSFSKNAGFTGVRLAYTVIPKNLKQNGMTLNAMWSRRCGCKFNGAPYVTQRAGEAVYSEQGKKECAEQVEYYLRNAEYMKKGLEEAGFEVFGGVNSPYIWLHTKDNMKSWDFFDWLLEKANIVGTPGVGFGPSGEYYFRLTAFNTYENTVRAIDRIKDLCK